MWAGNLALVTAAAFAGAAVYVSAVWRWLLEVALILANWPFTLVVIMPANRTLEETPPARTDADIRALPERWGQLHAVRTALGCASVPAYLRAAGGLG